MKIKTAKIIDFNKAKKKFLIEKAIKDKKVILFPKKGKDKE